MRSERGYAGTRALVGLGLVTLLIWIVPIMFLSRRQAELATPVVPAGASGEITAPASGAVPAGVSGPAAAPAAGAVPTGATGVTGVPAVGTAPSDPIGQAKDVQAQSLLNNAIQVAQLWYAETGTFATFSPEQAHEYEPSIAFTSDAAALEVVAIRVAPDAVVLVTLAESGPLCAAFAQSSVSFGRVDASTPELCQGGW